MLSLYTVDAFTDTPFCGNPAGVCIIDKYDDELCQKIAAEINLPETAFVIPIYKPDVDTDETKINDNTSTNSFKTTNQYYIRYWAPKKEINLCGHATLGCTHLLYSKGFVNIHKPIEYQTKHYGKLIASKPDASKDEYLMNLPAFINNPYDGDSQIVENILKLNSIKPIKTIVEAGEDLLVELDNVNLIEQCEPDFGKMKTILAEYRCVIITAKVPESDDIEKDIDFESRVFFPCYGVDEDPVCGSAHAALGVYWSLKLNKTGKWLKAYQASKRGGYLRVKYVKNTERMLIIGNAVTMTEISMMLQSKLQK